MNIRVFTILLCLCALPLRGMAQHQAEFQKANELFRQQSYAQAAAVYGQMIDQGVKDPVLYYNAGCALAALKQNGRAAAMFERALRLNPRYEKARQNLARVRPSTTTAKPMFILVPFEYLFDHFTADEFFLSTMIFYWLAIAAAIAWLFTRGMRRIASGTSAIVLLFAMLFCGGFYLLRAGREQWIEAVALNDNTIARSGPSEKNVEQDIIAAGVKMRCLESPQEGWIKVQLPNGHLGFVEQKAVEIL